MDQIDEQSEEVHIEYLADHTAYVSRLAEWHHDQWGYLSPGYTLQERTSRLHSKANKNMVPTSFVAIVADCPVGSASLVKCDMDIRPALEPWISSVFVHPSYRKRGIGTRLVSRVEVEADALGYSVLHLWTPDKSAFYSRRGWSLIERTAYRSEDAAIMCRPLGSRLSST